MFKTTEGAADCEVRSVIRFFVQSDGPQFGHPYLSARVTVPAFQDHSWDNGKSLQVSVTFKA